MQMQPRGGKEALRGKGAESCDDEQTRTRPLGAVRNPGGHSVYASLPGLSPPARFLMFN